MTQQKGNLIEQHCFVGRTVEMDTSSRELGGGTKPSSNGQVHVQVRGEPVACLGPACVDFNKTPGHETRQQRVLKHSTKEALA